MMQQSILGQEFCKRCVSDDPLSGLTKKVASHAVSQKATDIPLVQATRLRNSSIGGFFADGKCFIKVEAGYGLQADKIGVLRSLSEIP